jgi:hypothetical protein
MLITANRVEFYKDEKGLIHELGFDVWEPAYEKIYKTPCSTLFGNNFPECYFMFHFSSRLQFEVH